MPATHFTVPTREWAGNAQRTLIQGLHFHKASGYAIAHQADDVAGQTEQDVVFRCHKPDGSYIGAITLKGVGHGSSVGLYSTSNDSMEFWLGSETHNCVVKVAYKLGDKGVKAVTRTPLPKGDVSIDKSEDVLCLRTGNRYRGYLFSDAQVGKVTLLWDFNIPAWGERFQGHLIVDGKLFVHRDIRTGGPSRVYVFGYRNGGKQLQWFNTEGMGDEAEGCVEVDANLGNRFDLQPGIYAVKRTGGSGPNRVIEASRLPVTDQPPAPKRLHGSDVSSWQAGWKPLADDAFVFVKTSEGTSYTNPERAQQLDAARKAGVLVGHYHWLTPGNPLGQAGYFVANSDIRPGDPLWCDWERQSDGTHPTANEAAVFIAEVQRLVLTSKVGLYCNRSDWVGTSVKAGDGLWIAEYDVDKPGTDSDWVFWQHTRTPLDRNWAKFTSRADLDKWCQISRRPFPVIPNYDRAERIPFRGGLVCRCLAVSLPWVEYAMLEAGVIKYNLDFFQFGYRNDVAASARTHAGGQMIDTDQYSDEALKIWREFGYMMQYRTRAQGFMPHGHGGPKGCPHGSTGVGSARNQELAWNRGRDGLLQNGNITGPAPKGAATPKWDTALKAYLMKIGVPPVETN